MDASTYSRRKDIGKRLMNSRMSAGKTLEDMAELMGVSRNTISNWEHGIGIPDAIQIEDWYDALQKDVTRDFLEHRKPQVYGAVSTGDIGSKKQAIIDYINLYAPDLIIDELSFLLLGDHGSSPEAVMQKMTAYLQLPLNRRQPIASNVYSSYVVAESMNELNCPDAVHPSKELLKEAMDSGLAAVTNGLSGYSINKK